MAAKNVEDEETALLLNAPKSASDEQPEDLRLHPWKAFKKDWRGCSLRQHKWRLLWILCFLPYGVVYFYDLPGAVGMGPLNSIQARFQENGLLYTQQMNQALYSTYRFPNIILALFASVIIGNKIGLRKSILGTAFITTVGSVIFYLGVYFTIYPLLVVGSAFVGIGGEVLLVAQNMYTMRWYKEGEGQMLAFSFTMTMSRGFGSCMNFFMSPMLASTIGVDFAVLIAVLSCVLSLLSAVYLAVCDRRESKEGGSLPKEELATEWPFQLNQLKKLGTKFWVLAAVVAFGYSSVWPFIGIAKSFLESKWGNNGLLAGTTVSLFPFFEVSGGMAFIAFFMELKWGRFSIGTIIGGLSFIAVHVLLMLTTFSPSVLLILLGIPYSLLVSSVWPAIPFAVEDHHHMALAYGVISSLQNTGLAVVPLILGTILDRYTPAIPQPAPPGSLCYNHTQAKMSSNHTSPFFNGSDPIVFPPGSLIHCSNTTAAPIPTTQGFWYAELVFVILASCTLLFSVLLLRVDKARKGSNGLLTMRTKVRYELLKGMMAAAEHQPAKETQDPIDSSSVKSAHPKEEQEEQKGDDLDVMHSPPVDGGLVVINGDVHSLHSISSAASPAENVSR